MKLSKQRVILMVVLSLGLGALAVDRLAVGYDVTGPTKVHAAVVPVSATARPEPFELASSVTDQDQLDQHALTARLEAVELAQSIQLSDIADGFDAPASWDTPVIVAGEADSSEGGGLDGRYQLEAVMADQGRAWAMVNGKMLKPGDQLGHLKLLKVDKQNRLAVFDMDGRKVTLKWANLGQ